VGLRKNRSLLLAIGVLLCLTAGALTAPAWAAEEPAALQNLRAQQSRSPDDPALRARLGEALFEAGRALESMQVLNPGREPDPAWVAELRRAAELYAEAGRQEAAKQALRDAIELDPKDTGLYEALAAIYDGDRQPAEPDDADAEEAAAAQAAPEPASTAGDRLPPPHRAGRREGGVDVALLAVLAGMALAVLAAAALVLRGMRGKGDLVVAIEYPGDRRGSFTVSLESGRRRGAARKTAVATSRASSRFEHNMVSRETQFRGVPARSYWALLAGSLEAGESSAETRVTEEREVRIERGRAVRIEFDLRPKVCPVEVRIVEDGQPAKSARVALAGDLHSLRYAREGVARLELEPGKHTILAGGTKSVAERPLLIESLDPMALVIDLAEGPDVVFGACSAGVEPYLQGDLSVSATALERAGQTELAHLLRARFHHARRELEKATIHYESAGRLLDAAEAAAENAAYERAAVLFERVGDPARAAEMHTAAGDLLRAGRAYEEAGELEQAAECYREAAAIPKLIETLEKLGDHYEAACLARERGETTRATRNFQQVGPRHARYNEVCRTLAETFSEQGKLELAVQKADEAITFSGPDDASAESFAWYGGLLAKAGRFERALATLEELEDRWPDHGDVRVQIDQIKERVAAEASEQTQPTSGRSERYRIEGQLGRGGMGIVYRAHDTRLGRVVALKRLPENLKDHPRAVELFLREARSAAALNHPNIVTLHDVDQDADGFFLTMELLEGTPLNEIVRARGRVAPTDAARLAVQVTQGLQYAHERRIIHRDIKTANLFFTVDKVVKIMDFGLAKMVEEVRRASTVIGGTPYYMAPEQGTGEAVDARTDLYALGVTIFELITGRVPFCEGDVAYQHRHEPPPDPRTLVAGLPDALCELVLALMEKSPDDRPASAADVGSRLREI